MAKPISSAKSQEASDKTIATIKAIREHDDGDHGCEPLHNTVAVLADHAYAMGQTDLCFELQSMLLGKPSPSKATPGA